MAPTKGTERAFVADGTCTSLPICRLLDHTRGRAAAEGASHTVRTGGKLSASISSIEPANGGIVSSGSDSFNVPSVLSAGAWLLRDAPSCLPAYRDGREGRRPPVSCSIVPPATAHAREEFMGTQRAFSRRQMLAMSAAAGSLAVGDGYRSAGAQAAKRIERLDPALDQIVSASEPIVDLATNLGGTANVEGPLW